MEFLAVVSSSSFSPQDTLYVIQQLLICLLFIEYKCLAFVDSDCVINRVGGNQCSFG